MASLQVPKTSNVPGIGPSPIPTKTGPTDLSRIRQTKQVRNSMSQPQLHVSTYHYVRDLPRTRFPQIKGMLLDDFRQQVRSLPDFFEMATVNSALEFLNGTYHPRRDLCLMTFDNGLKEHYADVTPILEENGIEGVFFLITSCLEEHRVAPVHMNHFLTAGLGFERYRAMFMEVIRTSGFDERFEK